MTEFSFKGKKQLYSHHLAVPCKELKTDGAKSLTEKPSLDDNLIVHGDNLAALRALLPFYAGRVNCIYIDPPYNTGNESWCYNDNVSHPALTEWLGEEVGADDMERHDKWCAMMWPRLHLLKELLAEDGVIFISIDDNEQHRLRMLMDEIFGEENFVAQIIWRKKSGGGQDSEYLAKEHDYILTYRKSDEFVMKSRTTALNEKEFNQTKDGRLCKFLKLEKWGSGAYKTDRPTMFYPIKDPAGNDFFPKAPDGKDGRWRRSPNNLDKPYIHWAKDRSGRLIPFEVIYLDEQKPYKTMKDRTIFYELATTTDAANEQKVIFGEKVFDNSKPTGVIYRLIELTTSPDAIILDSFAGLGTTAQAVLALNKEDGGNRKFILVECEDYADKKTAERVRHVIKGVPQARDEALRRGLGGSFTYCTLGADISTRNLLKGKKYPDWDALARHVFFLGTGEQLSKTPTKNAHGFVGKSGRDGPCVYLLYEPSDDFLKSSESAFNEAHRAAIHKHSRGQQAIVYGVVCYTSLSRLKREYNITFVPLPWALLGS